MHGKRGDMEFFDKLIRGAFILRKWYIIHSTMIYPILITGVVIIGMLS